MLRNEADPKDGIAFRRRMSIQCQILETGDPTPHCLLLPAPIAATRFQKTGHTRNAIVLTES
jgi:hypothetical protein